MALEDVKVTKRYADGRAWIEAYADQLKNAIENVSATVNDNLEQLRQDLFTASYEYTNNGAAALGDSLQQQINSLASGGVPLTGTTSNTFIVRSASNSLTISAASLTSAITVTFPNTDGEVVLDTATQTLTNKTLTSPTLTLPQINDTSADHQYIFSVNELVADRQIALPLLAADDTFVFANHAETLVNKTLTSPSMTSPTVTSGGVSVTGDSTVTGDLEVTGAFGTSVGGIVLDRDSTSDLASIWFQTGGSTDWRLGTPTTQNFRLYNDITNDTVIDIDSSTNVTEFNFEIELPDVDPPTDHYHINMRSAIKGFATVSSGGAIAAGPDYNVSSASKSGTGQYQVVLDTGFTNALSWNAVATADTGLTGGICHTATANSTDLNFRLYDDAGSLVDGDIHFIVFGED